MKIPSYDERPGDKAFSGLGKKLLRKMGWSEGDGLGLGKDGIRNAIEIKKKDDLKGVGKTSERYNWEEKWWEGHFKKAADKFKAVVDLSAKDAVDGDDSDDGDDSETDEFEKNVRETMRDTTTATASATATKEKNVNGNDGVKYNGCAKELKVAREIAKEQGFRGRKGKLARVASFEEEQMKKYGIQTGTIDVRTTNNNNTKDSKAVAAAVVVTVEDEKSVNDGNNKKSSDKKKGESYEGKQSKTTKKSSWWRNAGFLWGGLVGSKRELDRDVIRKDDEDEDVDKNAKNGFTEKQQENIFKKAHEMASAKGSRRGLGDTAVNFTGKEFTGTKKAFDENDDDNDEKKKKKKKKERRLEKKEKLSSDDGDDKNDKKSKKKSKRKSRDEEDDINDDKKSKKKKSKKK